MHKIAGPIWGFFNFIRHKSPVPLSLDQYQYFFSALHHVDLSTLNNKDDLLRFTKIFWLNHSDFNAHYDFYFNSFTDWNALLQSPASEPVPNNSIQTENKSIPKFETKEADNSETKSKPSEPIQPKKSQSEEALVDFQLVLQESNVSSAQEESIQSFIRHDFALADQFIVPFDNRSFVQRLRRKVETADLVASDQLNVAAMIESYTRTGYIEEILYEMQDASHSNVVLLADRFGSMLAYEYLEEHFITGLRQLPYCTLEHYFFYNLPEETPDQMHYKFISAIIGQKDLETVRHKWNQHTWFLILSDAGAHSGVVNRERMKSTAKFWRYLRNISSHTHWINPVPFEYLNDCTAKRLQMTIPMIEPTEKTLYHMMYNK